MSGRRSIVAIGATVAIVIVAVSLVGWYVYLSPRPKITMTDSVTTNATPSCGIFFQTPQSIGASFTLINTGNADGFAVVKMTGGGNTLTENTYFVSVGQSVFKQIVVHTDCHNDFTVSVSIISVNKS